MRLNNFPATRTVWIRSLSNDCIIFTSDRRSEKINEIRANPECHLLWYLPMMKEQFRFSCRATIIDSDYIDNDDKINWQSKRQELWRESPQWLQSSFTNPAPGQPLIKSTMKMNNDEELTSAASSIAPLTNNPHQNFVLVIISPYQCDYLRLPVTVIDNSKPLHRESLLKPQKHQQRWLYKKDQTSNEWKIIQLNP